jgi:hypothetical protein
MRVFEERPLGHDPGVLGGSRQMGASGEWRDRVESSSGGVGVSDPAESGPPPGGAFAEHRLEPELAPAPPRPVPAVLLAGSYERRWRQRAFSGLVLAASMIALARLEVLAELSYYILALQYLDWIGLGILAIVAGSAIPHLFRRGRYRYVREGIPVAARVLACEHVLLGHKDFPSFAFAVHVEYRNPETRALETQWVRSGNIGAAAAANRHALPIRPGDQVTAVGLPGRFAKTLQLYGFLGLHPDVDYILKDGRPVREMPALAVLGISAGIVALLGLVLAVLYVVQFLAPIDNHAPALLGAGGGAALAALLALISLWAGSRKAALGLTAAQRWLAPLAFAVLGGMAGFVGASGWNAGLDRSPVNLREVEVVNLWQETWYPLFVRRYEIEYRELEGGGKRKHPARVEEMAGFRLGFGVIDVASGALGMPWVRGMHPIVLAPLEPGDPPEKAVISATVESPDGEPRELGLKPMVRLGDGSLLEPSPALAARIREAAAEK